MGEAMSGTVAKRRATARNARGTQSEVGQGPFSVVPTSIQRVEADGVRVFYRAAGDASSPVVLLLHGFPASSFRFRELIPRLANEHCVIAPDLPGFGFTQVPDDRNYVCTFDQLALTIEAFTQALKINRYAIYVFDPNKLVARGAGPSQGERDAGPHCPLGI